MIMEKKVAKVVTRNDDWKKQALSRKIGESMIFWTRKKMHKSCDEIHIFDKGGEIDAPIIIGKINNVLTGTYRVKDIFDIANEIDDIAALGIDSEFADSVEDFCDALNNHYNNGVYNEENWFESDSIIYVVVFEIDKLPLGKCKINYLENSGMLSAGVVYDRY